MSKAMSLKAKIRNIAKDKNIPAQVILQNYMFERLLVRLAASDYKDKFVLKGGMLVAAIVGLDNRATMDLDTTLKNLPLTPEAIIKALENICAVSADILSTTQHYNKAVFSEALKATAAHRGTTQQISDIKGILQNIQNSRELNSMWKKYRKQFAYAKDISYEQIMAILQQLLT